MEQMEQRLGSLEGAYLQVADRLNSMDHRLDSIDQGIATLRSDTRAETAELRSGVKGDIADLRSSVKADVAGLNERFRGLEQKIDVFRSDMDKRFNWLVGTMLTGFVALAAAFVFGWSSVIGAIAHR
jgi:predicted  nucleic acid-binding Zn-ribbon protein